MKRTEAIEWLKNIKEKYIHGGDDFYDYQRRTAIDYAMSVLENIEQKPKTNADLIRAMSDEELAELLSDDERACPPRHRNCRKHITECGGCWLEWLKQPVRED